MEPVSPQFNATEETEEYARFEVAPLVRGFGASLGNSLRRTLLSSLPGVAITSIKIAGVPHEFTAIPHSKEDVTELILNLKQVVLRGDISEPIALRLQVKGPKEVFARDIECPSEVEIASPNLYLCNIGPKGSLDIDLTAQAGVGYSSAEENRVEQQPIGTISIDSLFSPVKKTNFVYEPIRIGQDLGYEKLILEVWTNGSVSPRDAVKLASDIMVRHLSLFGGGSTAHMPSAEATKTSGIDAVLANMPIQELKLSVRTYNCLSASDIGTVGKLLQTKEEDLLQIRNLGRKSLEEVKQSLADRGLKLAE